MKHCGKVVGPVWKLGGESWACSRPVHRDGDHQAADGTWWVDDVCAPSLPPTPEGADE